MSGAKKAIYGSDRPLTPVKRLGKRSAVRGRSRARPAVRAPLLLLLLLMLAMLLTACLRSLCCAQRVLLCVHPANNADA